MYCVFLLGVFMWLAYGIIVSAMSMIIANSVTLCLAGSVLLMKLRFERAESPADSPESTK